MRKRPHQSPSNRRVKGLGWYLKNNKIQMGNWSGMVPTMWATEIINHGQSFTQTVSSAKPPKPKILGNPFKRLKGKKVIKLK